MVLFGCLVTSLFGCWVIWFLVIRLLSVCLFVSAFVWLFAKNMENHGKKVSKNRQKSVKNGVWGAQQSIGVVFGAKNLD